MLSQFVEWQSHLSWSQALAWLLVAALIVIFVAELVVFGVQILRKPK